ncbi:hypothetical protein HPB47_002230 [Ixodes persulcatus]|uniref:Uncharacterized protein n=1 Tax=Ixodes persulcatus TaxID=34615 RepID=A0AC60PMP5_IXOPE|nr:hypothetical protein HPB47_002230 [Ixodes persulcatus]
MPWYCAAQDCSNSVCYSGRPAHKFPTNMEARQRRLSLHGALRRRGLQDEPEVNAKSGPACKTGLFEAWRGAICHEMLPTVDLDSWTMKTGLSIGEMIHTKHRTTHKLAPECHNQAHRPKHAPQCKHTPARRQKQLPEANCGLGPTFRNTENPDAGKEKRLPAEPRPDPGVSNFSPKKWYPYHDDDRPPHSRQNPLYI